jgi:hypothetical protein
MNIEGRVLTPSPETPRCASVEWNTSLGLSVIDAAMGISFEGAGEIPGGDGR